MSIGKKLAAFGLAAVMSLSLTACMGGVTKADATVYIQGELDSTFKGVYNEDYLKLMDMTEAEAAENYTWNTEAEADILMSALDMYPTDATKEKVVELVKEIYSYSKYEVQPANKMESGSFAVEVLIEPIDILIQFVDNYDVNEIYSQVLSEHGIDSQEKLDAMSDADYEAMEDTYSDRVIEAIRGLIPGIGYCPEQSVILQLKLEDNVYTMVSTDWQKLDDMIIDYDGSYMS